MSLRRSPRRTPAFLAAHRANPQKSTEPRTEAGKERPAANAFRNGNRASAAYRGPKGVRLSTKPGAKAPEIAAKRAEIRANPECSTKQARYANISPNANSPKADLLRVPGPRQRCGSQGAGGIEQPPGTVIDHPRPSCPGGAGGWSNPDCGVESRLMPPDSRHGLERYSWVGKEHSDGDL